MSKPAPKIPIAALPEAGVMEEFSRLRAVLETTHAQIPQMLARQRTLERALGLAETESVKEQLADVVAEREAASRRRAAAIGSILDLDAALQSERAGLERQRQAFATHALAEFRARYSACVSDLQALWETARALGLALRCEVPTPLPVRVRESPVDGVSRAMPIRADVAGVVDAEAAALGQQLDQIDGALAMVAAVRQSQVFDQSHHRLGLLRGTAQPASGVYRVIQPFRNLVDGCEFLPGQLIDSSLIGSGMLHRLMAGKRHIEPAGLSAAA
jgi:hypothetical protein